MCIANSLQPEAPEITGKAPNPCHSADPAPQAALRFSLYNPPISGILIALTRERRARYGGWIKR